MAVASLFGSSSGGLGDKQTQSSDPSAWTKAQWKPLAQQIKDLNSHVYTPYSGQLTAGLDPMQMQAAGMAQANIGAGQGALGQAMGGARDAIGYKPTQIGAQSLGDTNLSRYLNPYMDNVAGNVLTQLDRGRQLAINNQGGDFTRAGAFGGSRHGVADAETNRAFADQAASTLSNLYNTGFNNAQNAAQFDIGNNLSAQQANQQAGLQGAGLNLNASGQLAGMAGQQQGMGQSDASFLNGFGSQAQQNAQQGLSNNYAEFLRGQGANQQQISNLLSLLGGIPGGQTTTQTNSPGLMSLIGSGMQMASLIGG
jgi:hypothetical protein